MLIVIDLLHFSQGPDNADVFMTPNEENTQHISEEILKESKIIQEEIESLLSEVCLINVTSSACKFPFCVIVLRIWQSLNTTERERERDKQVMLFFHCISSTILPSIHLCRGIFVTEWAGTPFWKFFLRRTLARMVFQNLFFLASL
jgi:hypothetical protein